MSYCSGCPQLSFCDTFKNPCNITEQQLQEDTRVRVENRTYFNGITRHGYQYPVREATNPGCRDPIVGKPALKDFLPKPDETDYAKNSERFHFLDIYSGLVNGINYGKVHRLVAHKKRHARSPYGPTQKFCIPLTSQMDYGWFFRDIDCLDKTKWYTPNQRFPQKRSEMTM